MAQEPKLIRISGTSINTLSLKNSPILKACVFGSWPIVAADGSIKGLNKASCARSLWATISSRRVLVPFPSIGSRICARCLLGLYWSRTNHPTVGSNAKVKFS